MRSPILDYLTTEVEAETYDFRLFVQTPSNKLIDSLENDSLDALSTCGSIEEQFSPSKAVQFIFHVTIEIRPILLAPEFFY